MSLSGIYGPILGSQSLHRYKQKPARTKWFVDPGPCLTWEGVLWAGEATLFRCHVHELHQWLNGWHQTADDSFEMILWPHLKIKVTVTSPFEKGSKFTGPWKPGYSPGYHLSKSGYNFLTWSHINDSWICMCAFIQPNMVPNNTWKCGNVFRVDFFAILGLIAGSHTFIPINVSFCDSHRNCPSSNFSRLGNPNLAFLHLICIVVQNKLRDTCCFAWTCFTTNDKNLAWRTVQCF